MRAQSAGGGTSRCVAVVEEEEAVAKVEGEGSVDLRILKSFLPTIE
jgi:hypothetical protein